MFELIIFTVYLIGAGASSAAFSVQQWKDTPAPLFSTVFWPVIMPVLIVRLLVTSMINGVKQERLSSDPSKRVEQYAAAPMSILLSMIGQKILANPDKFDKYDSYWYDKERNIKVHYDSYHKTLSSVNINGKILKRSDFDEKETDKFREILKTALKHREEVALAKKKADNNLLALDVIEKIFAENTTTVELKDLEKFSKGKYIAPSRKKEYL